jgi:hypothetical protein
MRLIGLVLVVCLLTASVVAGTPPADDDGNGLTSNESATLWSRDDDATTVPTDTGALNGLAQTSDVSFTDPPVTAETWTRNDFRELDAGDASTSLVPSHAEPEDGVIITDAHATIFGVHPATRAHRAPGETPLYVAPEGTLRGLIDYRLTTQNQTTILEHHVQKITLTADSRTLATGKDTQTPTLDYTLGDDDQTRLTLSATIAVELENQSLGRTTTETLTVTDSVVVHPYTLTAYPQYAQYPNGDSGVKLFQTHPWQGYTLTDDGNRRVRGVWRFYTARDTRWDSFEKRTGTDTETVASPAVPVYVHAYPSQIGPRTEPVGDEIELLDVWGTEQSSAASTLQENVTVGVVNDSYTPSYGIAVRSDELDPEALSVTPIVQGVDPTVVAPSEERTHRLRKSNLTLSVQSVNETHTTLTVRLRDAASGAPIVMERATRDRQLDDGRAGHITVANRTVETNSTGAATLTVRGHGFYRAQYHPESWVDHDVSYVGDTARTRAHPLSTISGWLTLLVEFLWRLIPFAVVLYMGRRLSAFLPTDNRY